MGLKGVEIIWVDLARDTLLESDIRLHSGASVLAVVRNGQLILNPSLMTVFEAGDRLGLIGDASQIESALTLIESPPTLVQGHAPRSAAA
jgi:K+/H+ antiporter YhaU regulatory subunit KhtT